MIELYGPESHGKTTLVLQLGARCVEMGGLVIGTDFEYTLDPARAEELGLPRDHLMMLEVDTCEDFFEGVESAIRQLYKNPDLRRRPVLVFMDTLAGAPLRSELEGKRFGDGMAGKAIFMRYAMRRLTHQLSKINGVGVFVNQVGSKIGGYVPGEETSGGRALKFHATLRLEVKRRRTIKREVDGIEKQVGHLARLRIVKSKLCRPDQYVEIPLYYDRGFDGDEAMIRFLEDVDPKEGPVRKAGAWGTIMGPDGEPVKRYQGQRWRKVLEDRPEIRQFLIEECYRYAAPSWWYERNAAK
jgi:recombination protein RecA